MLVSIDGEAARSWAHRAEQALAAARTGIDALNVFPVADADTGTNLHLTMAAAVGVLEQRWSADAGAGDVFAALAQGSLSGARGNSGAILCQLLHGCADALETTERIDGPLLVAALERADEQAWQAVARPVDGTMLSVSRAAAEAARAALTAGSAETHGVLGQVVDAAVAGATVALTGTTAQLEVLSRAGVVDAGGQGLLVLLRALHSVVAQDDTVPAVDVAPVVDPEHLPHAVSAGTDQRPVPAFEVMYGLTVDPHRSNPGQPDAVAALRARLDVVGDSVAVVGGAGDVRIHVHTDDAGAAVEAGLAVGRLYDVVITALSTAPTARLAVVCVTTGPALAALVTAAGAVPCPAGPDPAAPITDDAILDAVRSAASPTVLVLPNGPAARAAAERVVRRARAGGQRVVVLPTFALVQALAALAVFDADASAEGREDVDEVVTRMSAAAGACRHGVVAPGSAVEVARAAVARLLASGGELVTVVVGAGADPALVDAVREQVAESAPAAELTVIDGGQHDCVLSVGVE